MLEAPEQQRKIDNLEKENDRLRGKKQSERIRFTFSLEQLRVRRIVLRMFFLERVGNTRGEHSHLV